MQRWLFLLLVSLLSVNAAAQTMVRQVYVKIQTGHDDLRSDSRVSLVIGLSDNTEKVLTIVEGRRLADESVTSRVIGIDPPIPQPSITRIGIKFEPGQCSLPCENDQWEMLTLQVNKGSGPTDMLLWPPMGSDYAIGSARHKFTSGGTKNFDLPAYGTTRSRDVGLSHTPLGHWCHADGSCDDGLFCNGVELCNGATCVPGVPACATGGVCNEVTDSCDLVCPDRDGDGAADASCGGSDCDDRDPNRYPGNVEVMDPDGHDEDCDPATNGAPVSSLQDIQVCNERGVALLTPSGGIREAQCPSGTSCIPQPNGHGVCAAEPPGYRVPPRYTPARLQAPRAAGGLVVPGPARQPGTTKN